MSAPRRFKTDLANLFARTAPPPPDSPLPDSSAEPSSPRKRSSLPKFLARGRKKSSEPQPGPSRILPPPPLPQKSLPDITLPSLHPPQPRELTQSFGSKLAAHFTPSKTRTHKVSHRSSVISPPDTDSLSPPTPTPRNTSFDSTASDLVIQHRAATPKPLQPTITLSVPDPTDSYPDLFTRPRRKSTLNHSHPQNTDIFNDSDSAQLDSPLTPAHTRLPFPSASPHRISSDSLSLLPEVSPLPTDLARVPSTSSRTPSTSTVKGLDARGALSDSEPSTKRRTRTPSNEKRRTVGAVSYNLNEYSSSSAGNRSIELPSKPPTIPLPSTPLPSSNAASRKQVGDTVPRRVRAQTLASMPNSGTSTPTHASFSNGPLSSRRNRTSISSIEEKADKENMDIDKAPVEQVRQALKLKHQQLEELSTYVLQLTEAHSLEKTVLERKIATLEREAVRREKEVKGLTWLVANSRPSSSGGISGSGSKSMTSLSDHLDDRSSTPSIKLPIHRSLNADDSETESYSQTSGAESTFWSGAIGRDNIFVPPRKVKRHTLADARSNISHSSSAKHGLSIPLPDLSQLPKSSRKRSSMSSVTSSSSSSSLPSVPLPVTTPKLSAIPEAPLPPLPRSSRDPAIAAAILAAERLREKEERQASRPAHRLSVPLSPAPTPAAAYAANLKRGRPPSIAQVLDRSGNIPALNDSSSPVRSA